MASTRAKLHSASWCLRLPMLVKLVPQGDGYAPDRPHDLEAYNQGHAPPTVFWHIHPRLEAYEVEYDDDDGSHWWARLWLKA